MKLGMIDSWQKPEGIALSFFEMATRGPSLFSDRNPEIGILDLERGQMKKIKPLCLYKWGVFC